MTKQVIFAYTILIVFGVALFTFLDFKNTSVPYDDAYSVFIIKSSYVDIGKITAKDVHPPLYYWGLKTFSNLFGDSIFALRLFSMFGILATLLLGCFPIRKFFGNSVGVIFIILMIIFPVTQYLATDIRMYSWTMFFVLACSLFAYKVYKEGRFVAWVSFLLTGICAAYMHNYGLLSILGIYVCLFVFFVKSEKRWQYVLLCGLLFSIAYLPWSFQLINQIQDVAGDYWIKPLTLNDLFLHIYYLYSPKEVWLPFADFTKTQMMIGLIAILLIQLVLTIKVLILQRKENDESGLLVIFSFFCFLFPVFIGAVISILFMPMLVTRYMTCSFGLFALSLSFVLAKAMEYPMYKKLSYLFLALLFIDGGMRLYSGLNYYSQTENAYEQIRQFSKCEDREKQLFVINDFSYHVMPRLQIIVPNNKYAVLRNLGNSENFAPFLFDEIQLENIKNNNFILVHQQREAIQSDFRAFQAEIQKSFIAIDSLCASDIILYKMRAKDIGFP